MAVTPKASLKNRLAAHLVLVAILGMVCLGVVALYLTGIFNPVEGEVTLADTPSLDLATYAPHMEGLIEWLFPSAKAETADLDALLADILEEEEFTVDAAEIITVDEHNLSINENLPDNWTNVLLMATDGRDRTTKNGRTDVMILASVNDKTGEIKLISFARDMYIKIPGSSASNRINTAYTYGGGGKPGARLAIKAINEVFQLNIKYYAVVNLSDMVAIVDAVGGVDIEIMGEEYKNINEIVATSEDYEGFAKSSARRLFTVDDTLVHMDGLQAVSYARIRKTDNDLQRGSRQRILLNAILDKVMSSLTYSSIFSLTNTLIPNTDTNFPITTEGMRIGVALMTADSVTLTELSIPQPGSYNYARMPDRNGKEMEVITFNQSLNTMAIHDFIYGDFFPVTEP